MRAQQALRRSTNGIGRDDFVPTLRKAIRNSERFRDVVGLKETLSLAACERRCNFYRCSPPGENFCVFLEQLQQVLAGWFVRQQRNDRGRIPKSHSGRQREKMNSVLIGLRRDPIARHPRAVPSGVRGCLPPRECWPPIVDAAAVV